LHDLERIRRVRSFSAEQSQALGSLEDPEGCRHGGYYIKVGKVPIKKAQPSKPPRWILGTTEYRTGVNRISKARHGEAVGAIRYRPITVQCCKMSRCLLCCNALCYTRCSIRIRHLKPTTLAGCEKGSRRPPAASTFSGRRMPFEEGNNRQDEICVN
jgi:hypothetical protein